MDLGMVDSQFVVLDNRVEMNNGDLTKEDYLSKRKSNFVNLKSSLTKLDASNIRMVFYNVLFNIFID